jgi:hypothetical protein
VYVHGTPIAVGDYEYEVALKTPTGETKATGRIRVLAKPTPMVSWDSSITQVYYTIPNSVGGESYAHCPAAERDMANAEYRIIKILKNTRVDITLKTKFATQAPTLSGTLPPTVALQSPWWSDGGETMSIGGYTFGYHDPTPNSEAVYNFEITLTCGYYVAMEKVRMILVPWNSHLWWKYGGLLLSPRELAVRGARVAFKSNDRKIVGDYMYLSGAVGEGAWVSRLAYAVYWPSSSTSSTWWIALFDVGPTRVKTGYFTHDAVTLANGIPSAQSIATLAAGMREEECVEMVLPNDWLQK